MKLRVIIFEDETLIAERLIALIARYDKSIEVLGVFGTVDEGTKWLEDNAAPDLIFMDIQLSDGFCFDIFDRVKVASPIIFTTAYDEFALKAFRYNSIDYLLKPVDFADLEHSLDKFSDLSAARKPDSESIRQMINKFSASYKSRFLVKVGDQFRVIMADETAYFKFDSGFVSIVTKNKSEYITDFSLDKLEEMLDPTKFFRVNRKYIVSIESIQKISTYFNSRLQLELAPPALESVIVSRERVPSFKEWLDG